MNQEEQTILEVDEEGNLTGKYVEKVAAHTGSGAPHLAITVFVYHSNGEVLLQKRKHDVFDDIWENTASTHQLHNQDGTDETDEQATKRALKREYGIEEIELENLGGFRYFSQDGARCENEFCKLSIGIFDGEVKFNPEVGYEIKWMDKKDFLEDIEKNPQNYVPWAVEAIKILKEKGFFD